MCSKDGASRPQRHDRTNREGSKSEELTHDHSRICRRAETLDRDSFAIQ
jgi:hypothetical protein